MPLIGSCKIKKSITFLKIGLKIKQINSRWSDKKLRNTKYTYKRKIRLYKEFPCREAWSIIISSVLDDSHNSLLNDIKCISANEQFSLPRAMGSRRSEKIQDAQ